MAFKNHQRRKPAVLGKARLEAFSDGVIAIIITLMILEIKLPHIGEHVASGTIWKDLLGLLPNMIAYSLSFVVLGIYWVNHHNFFHHLKVVDARLLWLNLHLLFWLSLIPLPTAFIAEHHRLPEATAFYGFVMFMSALAYTFMTSYAGRHDIFVDTQVPKERLQKAISINWTTLALYFFSIFAGYINVYISIGIFVLTATIYFMPFALDGE